MYLVCSPPPSSPNCYHRRTKQGTLGLFLRRMSSLHGILTWDSCTWLVVSEFQQKCISIFQHWLQIPGSILIKELMDLDRCSYLVIFCFILFYSNSWKGNIMLGILTNPRLRICWKYWRGTSHQEVAELRHWSLVRNAVLLWCWSCKNSRQSSWYGRFFFFFKFITYIVRMTNCNVHAFV